MADDPKSVMGVHAPPPRITRAAVRLLALVVGVPVVVLLFAVDLLLWWVG